MLRVWVHGCDLGRVSDGSRLALCQTLSIECPSYLFLACIFCYSCSFLFVVFKRKIRTHLDLLSIPQLGGQNVKTFRWDQRLQIQLFVFLFCSYWSLVDVPLIFFCPADHVPDWQHGSSILLGMVEARSVNVKKTTTNTRFDISPPLRAVLMGTKSCTKILILPKIFPTRFRFTFYG